MTFAPTDTLWSDAQLEERWNRKRGYCAELRARGAGPRFIRLSPRVIRYKYSDIIEYEENHTYSSSAEALAADDGDFPPEAA